MVHIEVRSQCGRLVHIEVRSKVGTYSSSQEEPSAVSRRVVCQTNRDTVTGQLVCIRRCNDVVSLNLSIGNLTNDVGIGEPDDETVLGSVVLILVLSNETSAGEIVCLPLW